MDNLEFTDERQSALIIDIRGNYEFYGYSKVENETLWEGQAILYEDGWFEGIAKNSKDKLQNEALILGVYFPGRAIEVMQIMSDDNISHLVLSGEKNEKIYSGQCYLRDLFDLKLGSSRIKTRLAKRQDDLEDKVLAIETLIKESNFLYNEDLYNREAIIESVKSKYEIDKSDSKNR